jgi:hypothetical protein
MKEGEGGGGGPSSDRRAVDRSTAVARGWRARKAGAAHVVRPAWRVTAEGAGLRGGPEQCQVAIKQFKLIQMVSKQIKSVQASFNPNRTFPSSNNLK